MSTTDAEAPGSPAAGIVAALAFAAVALAVFPPGLNPYGPAKLAVTMLLTCVACMAVGVDPNARRGVREALRSPVAWAGVVLLGLAVMSLITTLDVRLAITGSYPNYTGLITGAAWAVLGLAAAAARPSGIRQALGRGGSLALVAVGVWALLQRFGLDPMPASAAFDSGRAASTLGNAANLGVFVTLALPLALDRARREGGQVWRIVGWAAVVLGAAAAGFSGSRGGWIGLVVGVGAAVLLTRKSERHELVTGVLAVAVVLALSILLTPVSASRATGGGTGEVTVRGRLAVWSSTLPMIAERPFLGWGPSGFGRAHTLFATPAEVDPRGRVEALEDPHNIVLSAAASTGVPGAIALLGMVVLTGAALLKARSRSIDGWPATLAASLAGAFVALQFHFVTLDSGVALAVLLGCVVGLARAEESEAAHTGGASAWLGSALVFLVLAIMGFGLTIADADLQHGFSVARTGAWERASNAFGAAQMLAPWEPAMQWAEGRAATDAFGGDPAAAKDGFLALTSAITRMPGDERPVRDMGDLHVAVAVAMPGANWMPALQAYDAALALAPTDPRAWLGKGVAQWGTGDLPGAVDSMRRSVALAPEFADAWENLAAVYEVAGEPAAAADARARAANARE